MRPFNESLGDERTGLFIQSDPDYLYVELDPGQHYVAMQYRKQKSNEIDIAEKNLRDKTWTKYSDSNLEAKIWPPMFPWGSSNWYTRSTLTM